MWRCKYKALCNIAICKLFNRFLLWQGHAPLVNVKARFCLLLLHVLLFSWVGWASCQRRKLAVFSLWRFSHWTWINIQLQGEEKSTDFCTLYNVRGWVAFRPRKGLLPGEILRRRLRLRVGRPTTKKTRRYFGYGGWGERAGSGLSVVATILGCRHALSSADTTVVHWSSYRNGPRGRGSVRRQ